MNIWEFDKKWLAVELGDITTLKVDAIVNAANPRLAGGGGVDGAIHQAAGPELPKACSNIIKKYGYLHTGKAVTTPGFKLQASYIIHTVGPIWHGGNDGEAELLTACYTNCIKEAEIHNCSSIAFPAVSCGVYGFPTKLAAPLALKAIAANLGHVENCLMVIHDHNELEIWVACAKQIFGDPKQISKNSLRIKTNDKEIASD